MKTGQKILQKRFEDLKPVYLIYGEDNYLIDNFIEKFTDNFSDKEDLDLIYLDDSEDDFLEKLNRSITTVSLLANKKIVISNCQEYFRSAKNDDSKIREIYKKLNDEVILLIAVKGKISKKLAVVKDLKKIGEVVHFQPPKYKQLDKWIKDKFKKQGKIVDKKIVKLLEHLFNNQLQRLDSEIEKICVYNIDKKKLSYNDVKDIISRDRMLADNVIFSFIDALCMRKKKKALVLLKEMLANGESALRILGNIRWQIQLLIQVKELKEKGNNVKKIAKILKQHPYPVGKAYKKCANFKDEELEIIMERLLQTNVDIVYGNYSSPELSMEMMINDVL